MFKVTEIVLQFRDVLLNSYPSIDAINAVDPVNLTAEGCIEALWEIILEIYIQAHYSPVVLYPYDEGSELCCDSGRVTNIDAAYTHHVVCLPKEGKILFDVYQREEISLTESDVLVFKKFVADSRYIREYQWLPFDLVHCKFNSKSFFLKIEDLDFYIREYY